MTDPVSIAAAAERLGVSSQWVYKLIDRGDLVRAPGRVGVTARSLDRYETGRRSPGRPKKDTTERTIQP